jgi:hypothetical protein
MAKLGLPDFNVSCMGMRTFTLLSLTLLP